MAGFQGQIGWKTETVYGTGVTVDTFSPLISESIANDGGTRLVSNGIRAGRRMVHTHKRGGKTIGGSLSMEFGNTDIAVLLRHLFGAVATSGAGPYTHTYTPGSLNDDSLTVQVGRASTNGTVNARTFTGVKIPTWTVNCSAGELAMLDLEVSAQDETGGTALASASYTSGWAPFSFVDGSITKGGTSVAVDSWSISGTNNLRTDRMKVGSNLITEQLENGMRELTISAEMDFEDLTVYNNFLDDDNLTLVCTLDNGTQSFTLTAKGYLTGASPTTSGPEILKQPLEFVAESTTSDADALTAVLVNSETSAA